MITAASTHLSRWLAPAAVVAVVLSVAGVRASAAGASPALPQISAADLLVKASHARVDALSGVVRTSTELGLPALPDTGGALSPQALLAGQHTLRVFLDGPDRQRVDLLGTLAETKGVHNGRDGWQWSSSSNKATHVRLPAPATNRPQRTTQPAGTPQALANQLLAAVTPTTVVSVGTAAIVAGRSAYDLRLSPKTRDSLVDRADLYLDSRTGLPLRVMVIARGAAHPAIDVGFTSIDLRRPAAQVFRFTPPPGTKVTEVAPPADPGQAKRAPTSARPVVRGSGWTAVAEIRGGSGRIDASGQLGMLLRGASTATGAFGSGRVVGTRLLTVLITDDGRLFAGAVSRSALLRVAGSAGHG